MVSKNAANLLTLAHLADIVQADIPDVFFLSFKDMGVATTCQCFSRIRQRLFSHWLKRLAAVSEPMPEPIKITSYSPMRQRGVGRQTGTQNKISIPDAFWFMRYVPDANF
jgi:hypothetical protein